MIKRLLSYFIPRIVFLTIVSGCVNYTNTGTEREAPAQEVDATYNLRNWGFIRL